MPDISLKTNKDGTFTAKVICDVKGCADSVVLGRGKTEKEAEEAALQNLKAHMTTDH
jgi:hypothetical protein